MSFPDPIEQLANDHKLGLKALGKMRWASKRLRDSGFDLETYQILKSAFHFIDTEIRSHSLREEDALFPVLEEKIGEEGIIVFIRAEHKQLWSTTDKLTEEIEGLPLASPDHEKITRIAELTSFIHDLLKKHIQTEDDTLLPLAREHLTHEDLKQVRLLMDELGERLPLKAGATGKITINSGS